jgi:hypothetical protein
MLAAKKKKGPLVKGKQGNKFDSASYELNKIKHHEKTEENIEKTA